MKSVPPSTHHHNAHTHTNVIFFILLEVIKHLPKTACADWSSFVHWSAKRGISKWIVIQNIEMSYKSLHRTHSDLEIWDYYKHTHTCFHHNQSDNQSDFPQELNLNLDSNTLWVSTWFLVPTWQKSALDGWSPHLTINYTIKVLIQIAQQNHSHTNRQRMGSQLYQIPGCVKSSIGRASCFEINILFCDYEKMDMKIGKSYVTCTHTKFICKLSNSSKE